MVADYGFLRSRDESVCPFLAIRVHPWKVFFALKCDVKGPDPRVTHRVAQLIRDCGLTHFAYKSDREAAIRVTLAEAAKLANVKAEDVSAALAADSADDGCLSVGFVSNMCEADVLDQLGYPFGHSGIGPLHIAKQGEEDLPRVDSHTKMMSPIRLWL